MDKKCEVCISKYEWQRYNKVLNLSKYYKIDFGDKRKVTLEEIASQGVNEKCIFDALVCFKKCNDEIFKFVEIIAEYIVPKLQPYMIESEFNAVYDYILKGKWSCLLNKNELEILITRAMSHFQGSKVSCNHEDFHKTTSLFNITYMLVLYGENISSTFYDYVDSAYFTEEESLRFSNIFREILGINKKEK